MTEQFIVIRRSAEANPAIRMTNATFGIRGVSATKSAKAIEHLAEKKVEVHDLDDQQWRELSHDDSVEAVARTMPLRLIEPVARSASQERIAWGIEAIGAHQAKSDGSSVCVAVLDTGIDVNHQAFRKISFSPKNLVDYTSEGTADKDGHGTHCAGTIFGGDVDGTRIGVAPGIRRVFIGKVIGSNGGSSASLFKALDDAVALGANVISMSLGFDFPGMVEKLTAEDWPVALATSRALESYRDNLEVFNAIQQKIGALSRLGEGAIVIAATGNESRVDTDPRHRIGAALPAAANGVIRVGAVAQHADGKLRVAPFSNGGASICAPGVNILSARAGGGLAVMDGTSMATPHVAGLAALWVEAAVRRGASRDLLGSAVRNMLAGASRRAILDASSYEYGEGLAITPPAE